jgi:hypothetical protein
MDGVIYQQNKELMLLVLLAMELYILLVVVAMGEEGYITFRLLRPQRPSTVDDETLQSLV